MRTPLHSPPCPQHPDRFGNVTCQRCGAPMCPSCMHEATVGWHCPTCVRTSHRRPVPAAASQPARAARQHPVIITPLLILLNVAVLAWDVNRGASLGISGPSEARESLGFWAPLFESGEWYRAFGYGFAHFGILHLALNMWGLWILGRVVEARFGSLPFAATYATGVVGGAVGVVVLEPNTLVAGASGAIFALMGAIFVIQWAAGLKVFSNGIGQLLLLNVAFSFSGFVSLGGHLGGLAAGLLSGAILAAMREQGPRTVALATIPILATGAGLWLSLTPLIERAV